MVRDHRKNWKRKNGSVLNNVWVTSQQLAEPALRFERAWAAGGRTASQAVLFCSLASGGTIMKKIPSSSISAVRKWAQCWWPTFPALISDHSYLANCILARTDPQWEPAAAASLVPLALAQDIALICKVLVHPGPLIITPEGISIELHKFHGMMGINLKSQVLIGIF